MKVDIPLNKKTKPNPHPEGSICTFLRNSVLVHFFFKLVQVHFKALELPFKFMWLIYIYCGVWHTEGRKQHFAVYNQNLIDRWMKRCILPFPKKGDLGLAKKYRGITLTSIPSKIYNALRRNRIEPKIDNILWKNRNGFQRNRSTTPQILTIRRILEGIRAKARHATILFVDFTMAFDSIHRGENGRNSTNIPKETVAAITNSL